MKKLLALVLVLISFAASAQNTITVGGGRRVVDSIRGRYVDTSSSPRNGYILAYDTVNLKWYLRPYPVITTYPDSLVLPLSTLGVVKNNSNFDNGPIINAAIVTASAQHKIVQGLGPYDTLYTKTQIIPQSYTGLIDINLKGNFTSTRPLMLNPYATTQLVDFKLIRVRVDRSGPNTDHGIMLSNTLRLYMESVWVTDDHRTAAGGGIGIGAFQAYANYKNIDGIYRDMHFVGCGNFGLQFGNATNTHVYGLTADSTYREQLGVEPYDDGTYHGGISGFWAYDVIIRTQVGTTPNGSNTGNLLITGTSGGPMRDVHINGAFVKSANFTSSHGLGIYAATDVWVSNFETDTTGGYGIQITSGVQGGSSSIHLDRIRVKAGGQDGVATAGIHIKDGTGIFISNVSDTLNSIGLYEEGVTAQCIYSNLDLRGNTTAFTLANNTNPSSLRGVKVDATFDGNTAMKYVNNQGSRFLAVSGGFGIPDWHTVDSAITARSGGGTVTSIPGKPWDPFNYGMVNDSVNSQSVSLQRAVDSAHLNGGGKVIIRAGKFAIGTKITSYPDVEIVGQGVGVTILSALAGVDTVMSISAPTFVVKHGRTDGWSNMISGLSIQGHLLANVGLYFQLAYRFKVSDIRIDSCVKYCVYNRGSLVGEFSNMILLGGQISNMYNLKINTPASGGVAPNLLTFTNCGFHYCPGISFAIDSSEGNILMTSVDFENNGTLHNPATGCISMTKQSPVGLYMNNCWFEINVGTLVRFASPISGQYISHTFINTQMTTNGGASYGVALDGGTQQFNLTLIGSSIINDSIDISINGTLVSEYKKINILLLGGSTYGTSDAPAGIRSYYFKDLSADNIGATLSTSQTQNAPVSVFSQFSGTIFAGAGKTGASATNSTGSTGMSGTLTVTTGSVTPVAGDTLVTIQQPTHTFSIEANPVITAANTNAAGLQFWVEFAGGYAYIRPKVAPTVSTVYKFNYLIPGK